MSVSLGSQYTRLMCRRSSKSFSYTLPIDDNDTAFTLDSNICQPTPAASIDEPAFIAHASDTPSPESHRHDRRHSEQPMVRSFDRNSSELLLESFMSWHFPSNPVLSPQNITTLSKACSLDCDELLLRYAVYFTSADTVQLDVLMNEGFGSRHEARSFFFRQVLVCSV